MFAPKQPHVIAERLLGAIDWGTDSNGYADCPGATLHTNSNGKRDCRVSLDGAPTIYCVHTSCKSEVEHANRALRSAIGRNSLGSSLRRRLTPEERCQQQKRKALEARTDYLIRGAKASLPGILRDFAVDPAELFESSPVQLGDDATNDWRLLLELFNPDDVVWIGETHQSGNPRFARHFRTAREWLSADSVSGSFTCPSSFKPGVSSRSNENIAAQRFLVVESDTLSKAEHCAVFSWCRQFLELRAIVDTKNRSFHGWFDFPNEECFAELKIILPALGCDSKMFTPSQPCRLPGAIRQDGKAETDAHPLDPWPTPRIQSLLFFNPNR
jgi:hypothetical protein